MTTTRTLLSTLLLGALAGPQTAGAQVIVTHAAQNTTANASAPAAQEPEEDTDANINLAQPDFVLVNLPTTLRLPRFKSAFRVTHRFTRPLNQDGLLEDFFGLDSGGFIGLEYRFGLMRGLQVGLLRTNDRTMQLYTHYNLLNQTAGKPMGLDVIASIDGTNNMRDSYTPMLGVNLSRELGDRAAVYVSPMWINNSNPLPGELVDDNDTITVGVGARVRIRPTVYLVGEVSPRTGYNPDFHQMSFGLEKRAGGHTFQVNFSNGLGNTPGQIARGASADDWYLGFNISRKFF